MHAVEQDLGREQVVGQDLGVVAGDLVALRVQQTLEGEKPEELLRLHGPEQHVQRDVVADETDREAERRHDPRVLEQRPRDHLHQADAQAEVDSAAPDERHRVVGHPAHQLDELFLVAHQRGDRQGTAGRRSGSGPPSSR